MTEFSLGMGPRLLSTVNGAEPGTPGSYLPFGGSCMMLGEDDGRYRKKASFGSKSALGEDFCHCGRADL